MHLNDDDVNYLCWQIFSIPPYKVNQGGARQQLSTIDQGYVYRLLMMRSLWGLE